MSNKDRPSLTERRATALRLDVARTAMRIFAEDGDTSATVERIAEEAGISTRTFHRHFPAKEDVIRPLFRYSSELTIRALGEIAPDADVIDALADALLAQPHQQDLTTSDLAFMQVVSRTPEFRLRWLEADDDLYVAVTAFLAERVDLGSDPRLHSLPAHLVMQAARYVIERLTLGDSPGELDELLRDALGMALGGISAASRQRSAPHRCPAVRSHPRSH